MSQEPVSHVSTQQAAPSSADPTTAGAIHSSNNTKVTSATTVSSLADLKKKAPKVYNAMLQGIGMNICSEMQHHQERLKKMMQKAREDSGQA